jgi:hypothetical protein
MTGQGVSGVFTTVVYFSIQGIYAALRAADNNGTLTVVDNSTATLEAIAEAAAVLYYFGSALSFLCVILVLALPRMPFYNYYYNKANRETKAAKKDLLDDGLGEDRRLADEALPTTSCGKLSFIFKRLWVSALSVFYVLYVAVAVYPGVLIATDTTSSPGLFFMSDWIVAVFNVGDYTGRFITRFEAVVPKKQHVTWLPAIFMTVWFVLAILSGLDFFESDAATYIITFLFAAHNGWASTIAMMLGPTVIPDTLKEFAGNIMVCCMLIGLGAGSFTGVGLASVVIGASEDSMCSNSTFINTTTIVSYN